MPPRLSTDSGDVKQHRILPGHSRRLQEAIFGTVLLHFQKFVSDTRDVLAKTLPDPRQMKATPLHTEMLSFMVDSVTIRSGNAFQGSQHIYKEVLHKFLRSYRTDKKYF